MGTPSPRRQPRVQNIDLSTHPSANGFNGVSDKHTSCRSIFKFYGESERKGGGECNVLSASKVHRAEHCMLPSGVWGLNCYRP